MSPSTSTSSFYDLLGIAANATFDQVRSAHRSLVRSLHPDVNTSPDAPAKFQRVQAAYETLIDPIRRAEYDRMRLAQPFSQSFSQGFPNTHRASDRTSQTGSVWVQQAADVARQNLRDEIDEEFEEFWRVFFIPRRMQRENASHNDKTP